MNVVALDREFSRERFVADIADVLKMDSIQLTDGFRPFDAGLDSIRLMMLIEKWRKHGLTLSFAELAERESIADWWALAMARTTIAIQAARRY